VLGNRRYLCGDELTEADVCLFTTLIRFDAVYFSHFKCNWRRVQDFTNLCQYVRELYQLPGIAGTCRFDDIKRHYYTSHPEIDPRGIVPFGPNLGWLDEAHDRRRLGGGPPPALRTAA
jgi:putative glutathione S-transferase